MSSLFITILLFFGASLQTLFSGPAILGSHEWPILLGLVLCISLKCDRVRALYAGLLAGLLNDSFCPAPLGASIPFFMFMALGVCLIREEVFGDQIITYAVLGFLGGLFQTLYFTTVFSALGLRPVGAGVFTARLFGGLLLGTLTAPLIFLLISALQSKRTRKLRWIEG
ncbi:MAG: hypothetical protein JEZ10_04460 [Verrucomicrobia bacterium]|nr:hypothetical protein [Verrucomicrobiota bacterium]